MNKTELLETKTEVKKRWKITYPLGFSATVNTLNDKFEGGFKFNQENPPREIRSHNLLERLCYVENIKELQNIHWGKEDFDVLLQLWREEKFKDLSSFSNFIEIDKLYYIGGRMNGLIFDTSGKPITVLTKCTDLTSRYYLDILTEEESDSFIKKLENYPWVTSYEKYEIPYYNREDENIPETTVRFEFLAPQELYEEAYRICKKLTEDTPYLGNISDLIGKYIKDGKFSEILYSD